MSASRATSVRSLGKLAASSATRQTRKLHMTGPSTFPSPLLTSEKPSFNKVQAAISDAVASQRNAEVQTSNNNRQFNTSRNLKSVRDTSTIDFMFMPDTDPDSGLPPPTLRVPLLPEALYPRSTKTSYTKEEQEIIEPKRPEINLISADSTYISPPSAFADVSDNGNVDFEGFADGIEKISDPIEEQSMVKQVWTDLLDDIFGSKSVKK